MVVSISFISFIIYLHYSFHLCSFLIFNRFLDSSNTVLCGSLTCPETTDTCVVTQISSDDLTTITTTRECRLGNKVLLSSATVEPNKYQVRVNNVASSGIGKPTAEDAQRTNEMVQAVFAHTNQVQNAIQNQIQANLANFPYFRYSKINKK